MGSCIIRWYWTDPAVIPINSLFGWQSNFLSFMTSAAQSKIIYFSTFEFKTSVHIAAHCSVQIRHTIQNPRSNHSKSQEISDPFRLLFYFLHCTVIFKPCISLTFIPFLIFPTQIAFIRMMFHRLSNKFFQNFKVSILSWNISFVWYSPIKLTFSLITSEFIILPVLHLSIKLRDLFRDSFHPLLHYS